MKIFCLSVVLVYFSSFLNGQEPFVLSGYVFDSKTGEVLSGANVFDQHARRGTSTNFYGFYSIYISDPNNAMLLFSYVGYKDTIIHAADIHEKNLNVRLHPGLSLEEITVESNRQSFINRAESGVIRLPVNEVRKLPNLFGEVDIIKAFQQTPGVQSGGEGKSELIVRGGSPDQNLLLLDDVPLYYVSHFGGFLSVFNVDAISDAKLIKGGFPARYGGRLSSVLEIRMKDGNMNQFAGQGMLGLISSKIMLEGPMVKGTSSYMISARRNTLPIFQFFGDGPSYNFYDINAKLNIIASFRDRIHLSFYNGIDAVGFEEETRLTYMKQQARWGNTMGALRWNRIFSNRLFANTTFAFSRYHYLNLFENKNQLDTISRHLQNNILTGVNDLFLKSDLSYTLLPGYDLKLGYKSIRHTFFPNHQEFQLAVTGKQQVRESFKPDITAWNHSVYVENDLDLRWLQINAGLRYSIFSVSEKSYNSLEPRIILNLLLARDVSLKYAYSQNRQFIHLLSYSGAGMPADYWMPSTKSIGPANSIQHSLGMAKTFMNGIFEFSLEAYVKTLNDLIAFKPGKSLAGHLDSWESLVEKNGKGHNYGTELFLQKKTGKSTGWLGITWSRAFREFNELNQGKMFPYAYDRPLDINVVWNYDWNENVKFSFAWNYGTGYPITLYTERYMIEGEEIYVFDKVNSFRMRDYHRLDFSVNFPAKTRWGERNWTISIYNIYNRRNPYYYFYDRKITEFQTTEVNGVQVHTGIPGDLKLYQRSLFGFFPSFGFSFKF